MKRAWVVLVSALLVVTVSRVTCQQTSEIRATTEAAIRAADAAGLKAAQAKDAVGATSNYADYASWLPPHATLVQGKEAIRSAWEQFLRAAGLRIDWQITKIDVSRAGDMAYALYKYQMTMSAPNGAPIDDRGRTWPCGSNNQTANGGWWPIASIPTCLSSRVQASEDLQCVPPNHLEFL